MNQKQNLYVDIHVLQTVPPSCVNRDDTGSPKTAVYGGVRRARVSSQAWKRAVRLDFQEKFRGEELGIRTKKVVKLIAEEIGRRDPSADAEKLAKEALEKAGLKIKGTVKDKERDTLVFLSAGQAAALAEIVCAKEKDKKKYREALAASPSFDLVLFGRMVAEDPSLNYDAAAQVAHSISTHEVQNEFDYFTAVDDLGEEGEAGAAHIGTVEFNSSTLYRYATVNIRELEAHLREGAPRVLRGFAESFLCSMPTGKQNTFANRTAPDAVYITIRSDQPVNLVGAFEKPVRSREGFAGESERRLTDYAKGTYEMFVNQPDLALGSTRGGPIGEIAQVLPLGQLLDRLEESVRERLSFSEVE